MALIEWRDFGPWNATVYAGVIRENPGSAPRRRWVHVGVVHPYRVGGVRTPRWRWALNDGRSEIAETKEEAKRMLEQVYDRG